jgi:hypothetical protein
MEGHFRVGDPLTHSGMPASTPETGRKS